MKKALTAMCAAAAVALPVAVAQGAVTPNDALYGKQWALPVIHAPEAWDRTIGSPNVKVAVVDSGVTMNQPELAPNIWENPGETGGGKESNGVDDDHNGFVDDWRGWDFVQQDNNPTDVYGHGTEVAGVLAARANNGIGVAGVAGRTTIIPVRILDNLNNGNCEEMAAGMDYAVRVGAQIVNVSGGYPDECKKFADVVHSAPGVLFVFAAMNNGADVEQHPIYPCVDPAPNVICVAATDQADNLWSHSDYGAQSVDLAAPGVDILSPLLTYGPREVLFEDGFEQKPDINWLADGVPNTWGLTQEDAHTGKGSLTDSPGGKFANNTDNWVYLMQLLDLRAKTGCFANVWIKRNFSPFPSTFEGSNDQIRVETSPDYVHWGRRMDGSADSSNGWELWQYDLSELEGLQSIGRFRYRLITDSVGAFDGVYLDDFKVVCLPPVTSFTGANGEFDVDSGTSFATPEVSGVAALLLSLNPNLSAVDVKQRILSSVDPLPSLAGKTVTGGRLNAAKAVATIPLPTPPANPANTTFAADLKALVKRLRARALLRGLTTGRVHAPGAGRVTIVVKSGKRTVAGGGRTVKRAGAYSLRVKATRRGRALLRHHRHLRVTVVLSFKPRSGPALSQSTTLTLAR
jgi:subtilisin family serine protease